MLPKNIYYHDRHVSSCKSILKTKQVLNYFSESDFNLSFFLFFFFDLLQYSRNILNNYSTAAYKNAYKAKKKKKQQRKRRVTSTKPAWASGSRKELSFATRHSRKGEEGGWTVWIRKDEQWITACLRRSWWRDV